MRVQNKVIIVKFEASSCVHIEPLLMSRKEDYTMSEGTKLGEFKENSEFHAQAKAGSAVATAANVVVELKATRLGELSEFEKSLFLEDEQLYQCCFCGHKFDEQDSLDFEWDRMIEGFAEKATPELCLDWISFPPKERKNLEYKKVSIKTLSNLGCIMYAKR